MLKLTRDWGVLTLWKTKKAESYVRTLSLKIPSGTVDWLGDVQGLIGTIIDTKRGDILTANIEEAFADGLDEALKKLPNSTAFETKFETVIAFINAALRRLLGENGLIIDQAEIHGAIVAQKNGEVAAAIWGKPSLILFRRTPEGGLRLIDVLAESQETQTTIITNSGFSHLISGQISGRDRLLVADKNLLTLLDKKCLQEILSVPRSDTVTLLLRDALLARHENLDLAMLLLDAQTQNDVHAKNETTEVQSTQKSIREKQVEAPATQKQFNDEIEKEVIYNPLAVAPMPKNEFQLRQHVTLLKKVLKNLQKKILPILKIIVHVSKQIGYEILLTGKKIGQQALGAFTTKKTIIKQCPKNLSEKESRIETTLPLKKSIQEKWRGLSLPDIIEKIIVRWNQLSMRSKKFFIAILVLMFIANTSLNVLGWKRDREEVVANYEKTISTIRQQLASAEASMIYRDEGRARRLLEEAAAAVAALPTDNDERVGLKTQLEEEVTNRFDALRYAIRLEAPEILSTIVSQSKTIDLQTLFMANEGLRVVSSNGAVFKISNDGSAKALYVPQDESNPELFLALTNGVLTGTKDNLTLITDSGKIMPQVISAAEFELNIKEATVYNSRLYILDSTHNRILKFTAVPGGFASPQVYIKDGTDLSKTVSMAIDGRIFALTSEGKIIKLSNGKNENFSTEIINPPLISPRLLRTPDDKSDLYVLDAGSPRIVRYDKENGRIVAQYESEELRGITNFVVDQKNRIILATKENRILRFIWPIEKIQ
jgi:hypothetical protein